jgi:hypothetical protein
MLQVVRAALPKFEAQELPLDRYEVSVFQQESSFIVLFDDPERGALCAQRCGGHAPAGKERDRGDAPHLTG